MARSGDFGWAGSGIWASGEGLETSKKVNLGRKWVETEDEGKSSREKLLVVSAVLLVVGVCQNTLQKFKIPLQYVPSNKLRSAPRKTGLTKPTIFVTKRVAVAPFELKLGPNGFYGRL